MSIEKLTQIINEWDPIGIISFTPKDEYAPEIKEIVKFLGVCNKDDIASLAEKIMIIFTQSFGSNIFTKQLQECKVIARKIFNVYINSNNDTYSKS